MFRGAAVRAGTAVLWRKQKIRRRADCLVSVQPSRVYARLSVQMDNSSQTLLVTIIKHPLVATALSTVGDNAFYDVFPVHT